MDTDVCASDIDDQSENILVKTDTVPDTLVITDTGLCEKMRKYTL